MNDGQTLWKKASQAETDWCSTILLSGYDKSNGVTGEEHQGLKAAARSQEEQGRPLSGCRENMPCQHLNFGFLTSRTQRKLFQATQFVVLGGSMIKNPPAMQKLQEMQVRSLGGEEPLKEGTATHSSVLA